MGVIQTSKDQSLLVTDSCKVQEKGKSKNKEPKAADSKPKQNQQDSERASGSKKKFGKTLCPYCENGYHLEYHYMRKELDEMSALLKQHNIQREKQLDNGHERCHALKAGLPRSTTYLIDSGASNHMVSSKDLFSSLNVKEGPTIHMGDYSKILVVGKDTIREKHGVFRDVLYVPSLASNMLYVYQMTHTGSPKQVLFGPDSVEIINISTGDIVEKGIVDHASRAYYFSHFMPFSVPASSQLPFKADECINIPSLPIAVSVLNPNSSDSDS